MCFGQLAFLTIVPVPETTMNKDGDFITGKDDIGFSGQLSDMNTKPESVRVQRPAHR